MMLGKLGKAGRQDAGISGSPAGVCREFEQLIAEEDRLLYGAALYFECLQLLCQGEEAVLETYRKEIRNLIQSGRESLKRAEELLDEVRAQPGKLALLEQYEFTTFEAHSDPTGMRQRAVALLSAYDQNFPGRPQEQAFSDDEILRLLDQASALLAIDGLGSGAITPD